MSQIGTLFFGEQTKSLSYDPSAMHIASVVPPAASNVSSHVTVIVWPTVSCVRPCESTVPFCMAGMGQGTGSGVDPRNG